MHILQPKHSKLNEKEIEELLGKLNISKAQLPKILFTDPGLPEGCEIGDVVKIERREKLEISSSSASTQSAEQKKGDKVNLYFRAVV